MQINLYAVSQASSLSNNQIYANYDSNISYHPEKVEAINEQKSLLNIKEI